jgi:hypothetical protein
MMVIICTESAVMAQSFVRNEIRLFGKLRKKVIPVDVDGHFNVLRADSVRIKTVNREPWFITPQVASSQRDSQGVKDQLFCSGALWLTMMCSIPFRHAFAVDFPLNRMFGYAPSTDCISFYRTAGNPTEKSHP